METQLKIIWMHNNHAMRVLRVTFMVFLLVLLVPACEKESERMDNYLVEFATVEIVDANYRFRLDDGRLLIPQEVKNYAGVEGQRVVVNYVPLEGDVVKINNVSDIFTGKIQQEGFPERYFDDPVKIQSVWVGGNYLNLIMETEYHSVAHSVALFHDLSSSSTDLYFSHSRNDDPPGYPKMMYASFLLSALRDQTGGEFPIPFRLFIHTNTEMRIFEMELIDIR